VGSQSGYNQASIDDSSDLAFLTDSLDLVELFMELDEEFRYMIPDEETPRIRTIRDLVDWIIRHQGNAD
jgi:acyl carrier protein